MHKRARFDYESDSLKFVVNGSFGTSNAPQMDSTLIRVHQSVAFHNLHIHSNQRGNLCP